VRHSFEPPPSLSLSLSLVVVVVIDVNEFASYMSGSGSSYETILLRKM